MIIPRTGSTGRAMAVGSSMNLHWPCVGLKLFRCEDRQSLRGSKTVSCSVEVEKTMKTLTNCIVSSFAPREEGDWRLGIRRIVGEGNNHSGWTFERYEGVSWSGKEQARVTAFQTQVFQLSISPFPSREKYQKQNGVAQDVR